MVLITVVVAHGNNRLEAGDRETLLGAGVAVEDAAALLRGRRAGRTEVVAARAAVLAVVVQPSRRRARRPSA